MKQIETLTNEMREDFIKICKEIQSSYGDNANYVRRKRVVQEALNRPAPRFYISREVAIRNVSLLLRGIDININTPIKMKMYEDILSKYKEWKNKFPEGNLTDGVSFVINNAAPQFYVSLDHAVNRLK